MWVDGTEGKREDRGNSTYREEGRHIEHKTGEEEGTQERRREGSKEGESLKEPA